jgi:hypothetical protein
MIVSGWNDGSPNNATRGGYGIWMSRRNRDGYFDPEWGSVTIELEELGTTEVNLAPSFWRGCTELREAAIGRWLLDRGLAPWPKGKPPRLGLEPMGHRRFRLSHT